MTVAQLSGDPQAAVSATQPGGNTTATWDPAITVTIPAGAFPGTYTGTITNSAY